jgi:hypothetical protein
MVYPALLPLIRLPAAPADLNGLVRFAERRNMVSARVPSHFKRTLLHNVTFYRVYTARDSSSGIATRYGLDESNPGGGKFLAPVQTGPGVHPASYTMGTGSFPGVKRPGRGVDHPPHLAPRLKKE